MDPLQGEVETFHDSVDEAVSQEVEVVCCIVQTMDQITNMNWCLVHRAVQDLVYN